MRLKHTLILFLLLAMLSGAASAPDPDPPPDNITLELSFNPSSVYIDGSNVGSNFYTTQSFDYPYIVSNQPAGIISYGPALNITYDNTSNEKFIVTQSEGTFLVPFTKGGHSSIEGKEDEVKNRRLLDILEPSFGFPDPVIRYIKASYVFDHNISDYRGSESDLDQLTIRNRIDGNDQVDLILKAD